MRSWIEQVKYRSCPIQLLFCLLLFTNWVSAIVDHLQLRIFCTLDDFPPFSSHPVWSSQWKAQADGTVFHNSELWPYTIFVFKEYFRYHWPPLHHHLQLMPKYVYPMEGQHRYHFYRRQAAFLGHHIYNRCKFQLIKHRSQCLNQFNAELAKSFGVQRMVDAFLRLNWNYYVFLNGHADLNPGPTAEVIVVEVWAYLQ